MIWIPGIRLCDGIAAEYAADKKLLKFRHNFDNDIISTSRTMAKRYQCMSRHTETVENMCSRSLTRCGDTMEWGRESGFCYRLPC